MRDKKGRFIKGHTLWNNPKSISTRIKKGERIGMSTEFKKKTGRWKSKGYIMIYSPGHQSANSSMGVFEHRLIMEQFIGRKLYKHEVVHHRNGIKTDNRIENLELLTISSHAQEHWDPITKKYANIFS